MVLLISILLILGAAFYFFIYPWMMQKFFNDPKTLFTNVIKEGKMEVIGEARKFEEDKEAEINRYNSH